MRIIDPYNGMGDWLKGTLHVHTSNSSCGHYPLDAIVAVYGDRILKYDFIAITDHRFLTDVTSQDGRCGLIVFNGVEFKDELFQTLGIHVSDYIDDETVTDNHADIFARVARQGGINVICHPHIYEDEYWPVNRLLELEGYLALEIYNHNVKMNNSGRAIATDVWDKLLTAGKRVFGLANDDMHHFSRLGGAYNMVAAARKDKSGILAALKRGSFYASTGINFSSIRSARGAVEVEIDDPRTPPALIRFIGKNGTVLQEAVGRAASCSVRGDESYVRVECHREDGAMAWSQPFFIEPDGGFPS
jgi:hypothetical protein